MKRTKLKRLVGIDLSRRSELVRCEFCDQPLIDERVFSDPGTMSAGLGTRLCGRLSCLEERCNTPLDMRLTIYMAAQCDDWRRR
jgi:hypothetical protein